MGNTTSLRHLRRRNNNNNTTIQHEDGLRAQELRITVWYYTLRHDVFNRLLLSLHRKAAQTSHGALWRPLHTLPVHTSDRRCALVGSQSPQLAFLARAVHLLVHIRRGNPARRRGSWLMPMRHYLQTFQLIQSKTIPSYRNHRTSIPLRQALF